MGMSGSLWIEAQLTTSVWSDLTSESHAPSGLSLRYGINGNRPLDCVASTGEMQFVIQNWATIGRIQGYYSPIHAGVRTGWTFGIPIQVVFAHGSDSAASVSSITRSSTTATVTTAAAHGHMTGDYVKIVGATQVEYNGTFQVTVTGATTFTFTVSIVATTPATGTITTRLVYVKHRGKIRVIDPDAGRYRSQLVRVTSYDGIRDLAETDLRAVTFQENKTESELISAILDALPTESQPIARDIDAGVDIFTYAFDDLTGGAKALGVIQDVAQSAFSLVFTKGDGTFTVQSRATRALGTSVFSFMDTMHGLEVPSTLENIYNVVRVTIHPRTISPAATEELYSLPTGSNIEVPAGQTRIVWTEYSDPNDRQTRIGGSSVVTALVGGVHYNANSVADGSGSNLTGSITASIEPYASTAKWTLANSDAVTAFIQGTNGLKVIGKAVRDVGPQTYEASVVGTTTRPFNIDLRYQSSGAIAHSYATYLQAQYASLDNQVGYMEFIANDSSDFMRQALMREPGDVVSVTETVTGSSLDAVIQSVELRVTQGPWIVCRWGLSPSAPFRSWVLGEAGRSELGETTVLGF